MSRPTRDSPQEGEKTTTLKTLTSLNKEVAQGLQGPGLLQRVGFFQRDHEDAGWRRLGSSTGLHVYSAGLVLGSKQALGWPNFGPNLAFWANFWPFWGLFFGRRVGPHFGPKHLSKKGFGDLTEAKRRPNKPSFQQANPRKNLAGIPEAVQRSLKQPETLRVAF